MSSREYSRPFSLPLDAELPSRKAFERAARHSFDLVCAATGLAVLAPVMLMIAVAIRLSDGGPVFFWQDRVGRGLKTFRLLKFRSMHYGASEGSQLTAPGDARVTRVGRFLRRYKLDELPQLMNVLKGEMQLVGVRPQVRRYVDFFPAEYGELLQTPPGITDLASLSFRNEELLFRACCIEELYVSKILPVKLQIALKYSRSRTLFSDLEILFRTVLGLKSPSSVWDGSNFDPGSLSPSKLIDRKFS